MISSPGRRFLAYILDILVSFILALIISLFIGLPSIFIADTENINSFFSGLYAVYIGVLILSTIIIQFYFWSKSTSMGKAILKMKVLDKRTRQPVGFLKMVLRELIGKQVSGLFFGLGYIWIFIDKDNQAWHDKIFDTIVVDQ
ncbi:RDD family protein [Clostridium senegalense]|uniref:RDD family protein n=1 Tax=Clostridium senegalense TaxID=1465809 RepID=UPI001C0F830C|nr:RDD family protein [Clostridium senegalense]MBU5227007.1 RDD family protein [Clostridium senegalense]